MAFWSGEKIKQLCPSLISEFDQKRVDCNAYTLRVGSRYFSTTDGKGSHGRYAVPKQIGAGQTFVIPPGQFAFVQTREEVEVPDYAMAFISIKTRFKWEGLVNVSGFHVDPGYKGHLIFSVYNASSSAVYLNEGLEFFLIWYADLDRKSQDIRPGGEKQLTRELIKGMGPIFSTQFLTKEIDRLKFKINVQSVVFGFAVVFFTGLFFALFNDWIGSEPSTGNAPHTVVIERGAPDRP